MSEKQDNGMVIAVSGKGGTGKTMVAAMLLRFFMKLDGLDILAIDADPDSNLPDAVGVKVHRTIGDAREEILRGESKYASSPTITKDMVFEAEVMEILLEAPEFDMVVMGRSEGPGCYCALNHILRGILDRLTKNYDITIMDTEAGLEHFSRRTTRNVDVLVIVTDVSQNGLMTAKRIKELSEELNMEFKHILMVVNRASPGAQSLVEELADSAGLEIVGWIPNDPLIEEYSLLGRPILGLPDNADSVKSFEPIFNHIMDKLDKKI